MTRLVVLPCRGLSVVWPER